MFLHHDLGILLALNRQLTRQEVQRRHHLIQFGVLIQRLCDKPVSPLVVAHLKLYAGQDFYYYGALVAHAGLLQ